MKMDHGTKSLGTNVVKEYILSQHNLSIRDKFVLNYSLGGDKYELLNIFRLRYNVYIKDSNIDKTVVNEQIMSLSITDKFYFHKAFTELILLFFLFI